MAFCGSWQCGRRLNVVFSLLFSQALHMPVDVAKSGSSIVCHGPPHCMHQLFSCLASLRTMRESLRPDAIDIASNAPYDFFCMDNAGA
jgi:hypothetical protein